MWKIEPKVRGYKVAFSDGNRHFSIFARDIDEAFNSLKHYLMVAHDCEKCPNCIEQKGE